MSAPKAKAPRFKQTYSDRMMTEMAAQIVELTEIIQNHLASHGANDARPVPKDVAFRKEHCEPCRLGMPHNKGTTCDGFNATPTPGMFDEFDREAGLR